MVRLDLTTEPKARPVAAGRASVTHTATPEQAGTAHTVPVHTVPVHTVPAQLAAPPGGHLARVGNALLQLQRLHGNQYVQQIVGHTRQAAHPSAAPVIQTKLLLGPADNCHEREADRVARDVVRWTAQRRTTGENENNALRPPSLQYRVHRSASSANEPMSAAAQRAIGHERGRGRALANRVREPMEQAFGADFSGVRIHTDIQSDRLSRSLRASAFTTGWDIFFRQGNQALDSHSGQELLAHELAHVVQQNGGALPRRCATSMMATAPSHGAPNYECAVVQRQYDYRYLSQQLSRQRRRAMGLTEEDEEREALVNRAGARATAEAREVAQTAEVRQRRAQAKAPLSRYIAGRRLLETGGARATAEAQGVVQTPEATRLAKVAFLAGHAGSGLLETGGARATAEARELTKEPSEGSKRRPRLTSLVKRRGLRGDMDRPDVELTKGRKKRRAADERDVQQKDKAEQDRATFLEQRQADYYLGECISLHQEIEAAHPKLRDSLDSKTKSGASDAATQAKAIGATPARIDELQALAEGVAVLRPDWRMHVGAVLNKAESKITGPYNLKTDLNILAAYNMPDLRKAKTDVEHIIATKNWLDPGDAVERLNAEYNEVRPLHLWVERLTKRIAYLKKKVSVALKSEIDQAETTLGTATTKTRAQLEKLLKGLDSTLLSHQQVVAADKFQAKVGDDDAVNSALEKLLDHDVIRRGIFNKKYSSSWDTHGGYSVEYTVVGLQNIVIHAHCNSSGSPKIGTSNAVHWKLKSEKFTPGASHPISDKLAKALVDPETHKSKPLTQG
ncbi:MAG: eCIS core domain-containing protein [Pseudonocardiales bacterium]